MYQIDKGKIQNITKGFIDKHLTIHQSFMKDVKNITGALDNTQNTIKKFCINTKRVLRYYPIWSEDYLSIISDLPSMTIPYKVTGEEFEEKLQEFLCYYR